MAFFLGVVDRRDQGSCERCEDRVELELVLHGAAVPASRRLDVAELDQVLAGAAATVRASTSTYRHRGDKAFERRAARLD